MTLTATEPVQIRAHRRVVKRLGAWTTARRFDVRASRGLVVRDLLLPEIEPGEIEVALDIDHATSSCSFPTARTSTTTTCAGSAAAASRTGPGTGAPDGRRIKLIGELRNAEVRIHRGGVAILSLLLTPRHRGEVRRAHREGRL